MSSNLFSARRTFLKGSMAATAAAIITARNAQAEAGKINILYLHSHDSGRYLEPYGHRVPTPHLYRLARQGVLFRQVHTAAPTCSPSRAALLTGQCPHSNGMMGLAHLGWNLRDRDHLLPRFLSRSGYHTILAGLQHVAANDSDLGYDQILPHASTHAADVAPAAARFLSSKPQQPFFLDVGFFETHREYPVPTDDPRFIQPPFPVPDNADTRRDMAGFHASACALDRGVGLVLDALERAGLAGNTLVLSTTDHGIAFPRMKCDLRDTGTGISMILRGPGVFSSPGVCDTLLSNIDVFPTLCDYLGLERPDWLEGRSFLPVLEGKAAGANTEVYSEVTYHAAYEPKRSVRTDHWKYIRHFDNRTTAVLPNCDDSPSKSVWLTHGWRQEPLVAHEELYDLIFDPAESRNLAAEPHMKEQLMLLREQLQHWMERTDDPLLKGPVPLAAGGHTVSPDAESPKTLSHYFHPES